MHEYGMGWGTWLKRGRTCLGRAWTSLGLPRTCPGRPWTTLGQPRGTVLSREPTRRAARPSPRKTPGACFVDSPSSPSSLTSSVATGTTAVARYSPRYVPRPCPPWTSSTRDARSRAPAPCTALRSRRLAPWTPPAMCPRSATGQSWTQRETFSPTLRGSRSTAAAHHACTASSHAMVATARPRVLQRYLDPATGARGRSATVPHASRRLPQSRRFTPATARRSRGGAAATNRGPTCAGRAGW
jgi:hypothetical protein